jgi:2-methylcitrate dehydratase PrpD
MSSDKPPLLADATRDLARFGAALRYDDIPADAIARIKLSLLDSLGCCLFGATLPWTKKVAALAEREGAAPVATLFGLGRKTSASLAALVNGTSGHAFELDDIHKESIIHAGSIATPVALGLGELGAKNGKKISGRDVLTAMVAGYEIGHRVGNAATMSLFFRGFHPQGTSGTFVAAATAARMLNLDAQQFQHALGMAGSQAGGLMAAQEGAMVKRFHSGRAAQSGVYAAQLAADGFTGILDALEAPYGGYLSTYSDKPNPSRLTDGLGTEGLGNEELGNERVGRTWETLNVGYKPHASVTSIHSALDGLLAIMQEQKLKAADIAKVETGLSPMTHVHCAWEYKAQGVTAAQMNLYYGMAVIALDGAAFTEQFREARLSDPQILDFISRITAHVDPEIEKMGAPFRHASRVRITARNGKVHEKLSLHRRGSPENPLSAEEVVHKFRNVVAPCMDKAAAEDVIAAVNDFETLADISTVMPLLGAAVRTPK